MQYKLSHCPDWGTPQSGTQPRTGPAQAGRAGRGAAAREMTLAATTQEEET